jgi:hypothetical protein
MIGGATEGRGRSVVCGFRVSCVAYRIALHGSGSAIDCCVVSVARMADFRLSDEAILRRRTDARTPLRILLKILWVKAVGVEEPGSQHQTSVFELV